MGNFWLYIIIGLTAGGCYGIYERLVKKKSQANQSSPLIVCSDCKKEYSGSLTQCWHCGAKSPTPKKPSNSWIIYVIAFGGIAYSYDFFDSNPETPTEKSCKSDWKLCANNQQIMDVSGKWEEAAAACKVATKAQSKYGNPDFPLYSFASYNKGNDFIETGVMDIAEKNAQFQNEYGVMVHTLVKCTYDINQGKVMNIYIE